MSWSVVAIGKAPAVRESISKQFDGSLCTEPEESIRQSAKALIDLALAKYGPTVAVKVSAAGSQGFRHRPKAEIFNNVTLSIEAMTSFVE